MVAVRVRPMRSLDLGLYELSTNEKFVVGGLGVIIKSNLNRVRLSCCWVGVGLGCDNIIIYPAPCILCYTALHR